jgi:small subunit ribosomal protein S8
MMTDPIADMLTRLRNAGGSGKKQVAIPASRLKVGIAEVLKEEGFIGAYEVQPGEPRSELVVDLKYGPDGQRVLRSIDRVSKPGRRVYSSAKDVPQVLGGMGIYVLTTPQGVLSDRQARKMNVGGEILCRVS